MGADTPGQLAGDAQAGSAAIINAAGWRVLIFLFRASQSESTANLHMGTSAKANFGGDSVRSNGRGLQPDAPVVPTGAAVLPVLHHVSEVTPYEHSTNVAAVCSGSSRSRETARIGRDALCDSDGQSGAPEAGAKDCPGRPGPDASGCNCPAGSTAGDIVPPTESAVRHTLADFC